MACRPLTVTLPWREVPFGLGAAWKATAALPCPEVGDSPDIQVASAEAVHVHSGWVATAMLPAPPAASSVDGDAVTETEHFTGVGPSAVVVVDVEPQAATAAANTIARNNRIRSRSDSPIASLSSLLGFVMMQGKLSDSQLGNKDISLNKRPESGEPLASPIPNT